MIETKSDLVYEKKVLAFSLHGWMDLLDCTVIYTFCFKL